jgi:hypothetical protein
MEFRTVADLEQSIWKNLHRFPADIDTVVGIPRSGLMAGSIAALMLNLPLADVDGYAAGRSFCTGRTRPVRALRGGARPKVLLVDDSVRTGDAMRAARAQLTEACPGIEIVTCAIYAAPEVAHTVDLPLELVATPRLFLWNAMHHPFISNACLDLDGVLCVDPTEADNDDGPCYEAFLAQVRPLHLPAQRIGTIVTSRLERYRPQTEEWLARHGVMYDKLVMLDLPDAATRQRLGCHASFKAEYYRASNAVLFIESDREQAADISLISGKPTLWLGGPVLFRPDRGPDKAMLASMSRVRRDAVLRLKNALRRSLGQGRYDWAKRMVRDPLVAVWSASRQGIATSRKQIWRSVPEK